MVRFIHTADWQLGMRRHFLDEDAQARFSAARIDAIGRIGELAGAEEAAFVVVAGDVFESNHLDRRTVRRALDAIATVPVPVYLLPGNHDPLDAASIYTSAAFETHAPDHVHVLGTTEPQEPTAGVQVIGAPWRTKRPVTDPCADAHADLDPASDGTVRIVVGHGVADVLSPDRDAPDTVSVGALEAALDDGRVHYVALGDRHSVTDVGDSGRIWYAGAPEPTDYDEVDPGQVLVVDLDPDGCEVRAEPVATWRFERPEPFHLSGDGDIDRVRAWLDAIEDKPRTIVKLGFVGTVSLAGQAELDRLIDSEREVFAAIERWERRTDLAVRLGEDDLAELDLSGFARDAAEELAETAAGDDEEEADTARDALGLLHRLAGGER